MREPTPYEEILLRLSWRQLAAAGRHIVTARHRAFALQDETGLLRCYRCEWSR